MAASSDRFMPDFGKGVTSGFTGFVASCDFPTSTGVTVDGVVLGSDLGSDDEVGLAEGVGVDAALGFVFVCEAFRAGGSWGKRARAVGDNLKRTILLGFNCLADREVDVGVETLDNELGGAIVEARWR